METNVKNVNRDIIGVIIVGIVIVTGIYIFTSLADIGGTRGTTEYFSASENSTMNTSSVLISPIEDGVSSFSAQVYNHTWLNFDGSGDYVQKNVTDMNDNTKGFTIYGWVKPTNILSPSTQALFTKHNDSNSKNGTGFYSYISANGKISIGIYNETQIRTLINSQIVFSNTTTNPYKLLTITINSTNYYCLFVDGIRDTCYQVKGSLNPSLDQNFTIGAYSYTKTINFNGTLDEFGYYNYVINDSKINLLYINKSGYVPVPHFYIHGVQDSRVSGDYLNVSEFTSFMNQLHTLGFESITDFEFYNWTQDQGFVMPEKPFMLIFDGAYLSVYTNATSILDGLGYKAILAPVTSKIMTNNETYMTWGQINDLIVNHGWSISSHGWTDCDMGDRLNMQPYCNDTTTRRANLSQAKQDIIDQTGITPIMHTFLYNDYGSTTAMKTASMLDCSLYYDLCFGKGYTFPNVAFNTKTFNLTNGQLVRIEINNATQLSDFVLHLGYDLEDKDLYWKFNENTGTTAYDSSGNGNHGTISGATWQNDGVLVSLSSSDVNVNSQSGLLTLLNSEYLYSYIVKYWTYFKESTNPGTTASLVMVDSLGNSTTFLSLLIVISFAVVILTLFKPSVNTNPLGKPHY